MRGFLVPTRVRPDGYKFPSIVKMNNTKQTHPGLALSACMCVMMLFGSVHSFSVFLTPLETQLGISRAEVSSLYSFALVFLTISVLFGYRLYSFLTPAKMLGGCCLIAAFGLGITAWAKIWWWMFFGYSVVFGCVNGIGYGYALQLCARVFPEKKGFAMGSVTAAYGFGSIVFSFVFSTLIAQGGAALAMQSISGILVFIGLACMAMLAISRVRYTDLDGLVANKKAVSDSDKRMDDDHLEPLGHKPPRVAHYWIAYFLSILSGLMVIGHAAAMVESEGASASVSFWGAVMVGVGSTIGGFLSGHLVDRWPLSLFLQGLPLLAGFSLLLLIGTENIMVIILLLCIVGFSYGSIITIYPVAIASDYTEQSGPKIYGRVFTGWGIAGLLGPWVAGAVFDQYRDYDYSIAAAALTAFLATLVVRFSSVSRSRVR